MNRITATLPPIRPLTLALSPTYGLDSINDDNIRQAMIRQSVAAYHSTGLPCPCRMGQRATGRVVGGAARTLGPAGLRGWRNSRS